LSVRTASSAFIAFNSPMMAFSSGLVTNVRASKNQMLFPDAGGGPCAGG
jgi:hypothetical protein